MAATGRWIPHRYGEPAGAGEFGDMFGGLNALFSGFAFVGLIYAILLQRRELQLQREELEDTRAELKGQKDQLEAQNRTLLRQTFDNAFFQLLGLHHQIVNAIDRREGSADADAIQQGRDCFVFYYSALRRRLQGDPRFTVGATRENIRIAYNELYNEFQADIGHYFRNLYNIVKFVDRSQIEDKRTYTNLIRAQLSSHELLMLFYNCLTHIGEEKFKPLLEKYSLLKNMPHEELLDESHIRWYERRAFFSSEAAAQQDAAAEGAPRE
jgi:hypothetical protein